MSSSSGSGVQQVLDIEVYQKSPASVVFSLSKLPPAFNPPFTGLLKLERRKADLQPSIATEALEVSRAA